MLYTIGEDSLVSIAQRTIRCFPKDGLALQVIQTLKNLVRNQPPLVTWCLATTHRHGCDFVCLYKVSLQIPHSIITSPYFIPKDHC